MTGETMTPLAVIGVAVGAAAFSSPSLARTISACVPSAERAALAAVEKTPAIGQETIYGSPYVASPGVLRVEVDVFGPQSINYNVDVTLDGACNVLATSTTLENNPWRGR